MATSTSQIISTMCAAVLLGACFTDAPSVGTDDDGEEEGSSSSSSGDSTAVTTLPPSTTADETGSGTAGATEPDTDESTSDSGEPPSPFARWAFDDDLRDDDAGVFDAEMQGEGPLFETVEDRTALRLDGTGFVDLSTAAVPYRAALDAVTVTVVLRADTWDTPRSTLLSLGLPSPEPEDNAFIFRIDDGNAEVYMETSEFGEQFFPLGPPPPAEAWHRITLVVDGASATYYIDAQQIATISISASDTTSDVLQFGSWAGGNYFFGLVDELALYDVALTSDEVANL